jgi:uncharacterized protein (TIGR03663 family)
VGRRIAGRLGDRPRGELAAYAVLVALALALRLIDLGSRPFHHDESQDAYFSWILFTKGDYRYQPILHGPLRFYMTAGVYALLGASDFTARLAPALMGTAMVALPYGLRRQLGRAGAFAAAALLAVGPSYLYFSRFAREDIYIAAITLALLVAVFRFLDGPQRWHPALIGALLAASFATKESTFITVFVAGTFFLALVAREGREAPTLRTAASVGWEAWGWGVAAFAAVFTLLFTVFLTNPAGLWDGIYEGLHYWLGQQPVGRGGEPAYYYVIVLFAHEWPVLALGAVGAVVAFRRPTVLRAFLVWAFALSLAVYSWAGEKFPWLVLHPLLPLILLAGLGVQALWEARRRPAGRAGLVVAALAAVYVGVASWYANVEHRTDPREFLVSTQSSEQVPHVADEVLALARRHRNLTITVDAADGATFPWAWYFREESVGYVDLSRVAAPPGSDVLIMTGPDRDRLQGGLPGYAQRRFPFRVWWVRDYGGQSPANWARWLWSRRTWNPTGGLPEWLLIKRGGA